MQQTDSAPQSSGADQNDRAWKKNTGKQSQIQQQQVSFAVQIGRGVTFLVKWLWLLTMFFIGIGIGLLMQSEIFEYSYSLSELDLAETLFMVGLLWFTFHYIKLCSRSNAPLVRKIIMPFVHQAQVFLVAFFGMVIYSKANKLVLHDYGSMPLLELARYILILITLGYSYYWIADMGANNSESSDPVIEKSANKPSSDLNSGNQKGFDSTGQSASVNQGGVE